MTNTIKPLPPIARALKALLVGGYDLATDEKVGGDLSYDAGEDFYVRIDQWGGSADRFEGRFIVDLEVFGDNYLTTESRSLDIDALLLGYPHVVEVDGRKVVFDDVSQNELPHELPWEDDTVTRLGATYVITARRR